MRFRGYRAVERAANESWVYGPPEDPPMPTPDPQCPYCHSELCRGAVTQVIDDCADYQDEQREG